MADGESKMKDKDKVLLQPEKEQTGIRLGHGNMMLRFKELEEKSLDASNVQRTIKLLNNDMAEMKIKYRRESRSSQKGAVSDHEERFQKEVNAKMKL
ncbi:hypothetical protein scyTo_0003092 [Scyliorhinus torazame]|uniref:Uncharacterized protein n=1 Tax=Scyliorhinus torazame TaxID=75743 RepID=A0A401PLN1_SCYTO|nr:hypothetical protein [Scyliorhinus torazame]